MKKLKQWATKEYFRTWSGKIFILLLNITLLIPKYLHKYVLILNVFGDCIKYN